MQLPWSGNVRQLENVCRWLTVMSATQEVLPQDLPADLTMTAAGEHIRSEHSHNPAAGNWDQQLAQWADAQLRAGKPICWRMLCRCLNAPCYSAH